MKKVLAIVLSALLLVAALVGLSLIHILISHSLRSLPPIRQGGHAVQF